MSRTQTMQYFAGVGLKEWAMFVDIAADYSMQKYLTNKSISI
jgi:hypothetical protein